jgi:hypothetical protein
VQAYAPAQSAPSDNVSESARRGILPLAVARRATGAGRRRFSVMGRWLDRVVRELAKGRRREDLLTRMVLCGVLLMPALALSGCFRSGGSDEQRLSCLSNCAREMDLCILAAVSPETIRQCDERGQNCSEACTP